MEDAKKYRKLNPDSLYEKMISEKSFNIPLGRHTLTARRKMHQYRSSKDTKRALAESLVREYFDKKVISKEDVDLILEIFDKLLTVKNKPDGMRVLGSTKEDAKMLLLEWMAYKRPRQLKPLINSLSMKEEKAESKVRETPTCSDCGKDISEEDFKDYKGHCLECF